MTKGASKKRPTTGIGGMIRAYRAVHDLTLREFAKLVGVTAPTIMRIEEGRQTDAGTWLKLQMWMLSKGVWYSK